MITQTVQGRADMRAGWLDRMRSQRPRYGRLLPLLVVAGPGVLLRVVTILGFRQPVWTPDSAEYLQCAINPAPLRDRPCGYSFFVKLLEPLHSVLFVVIVQHALGVAAGAAVYLLLIRRFGMRPAVAALVVAPVLLDSDIIGIEHYFLSDALFCYLLLAAVVVLLWHREFSWTAAGIAGLLVGVAAEVRSVGLPVILVFVAYVLVRRRGLWAAAALILAAALPVVAYAGWAQSGGRSANGPTGTFLWGRVAVFADCAKIRPHGDLAKLCPQPSMRRWHMADYVWEQKSPIRQISSDQFAPRASKLGMQFTERAIIAQPFDYTRLIFKQAAMAVEPSFMLPHYAAYNGDWYKFRLPYMHRPANAYLSDRPHYDDGPPPRPHRNPYRRLMIDYQRFATVPGPVLGIVLLVGFAGVVRRYRNLGGPALLPWVTAVALLVIPIMTADYDFRYVLPMIPFSFIAAGLACTPRDTL